jgi:hypothetical protein
MDNKSNIIDYVNIATINSTDFEYLVETVDVNELRVRVKLERQGLTGKEVESIIAIWRLHHG